LKILFCHFGIVYKGGFNRTFHLARGVARLGHEVVFFTCQSGWKHFPYRRELKDGVLLYKFPDFFPKKIVSKGFGLFSTLLKILEIRNHNFDIVHSDSGHRPSAGWPCYYAKKLHNAKYVSEWWDYFGKNGQLKTKPFLFRVLLGWFENNSEIKNKIKADAVVVLSEYMRNRAIDLGIPKEKLYKIHGGADLNFVKFDISKFSLDVGKYQLVLGYIGLTKGDIIDIEELLKIFKNKEISERVLFVTYGFKFNSYEIHKYFPFGNIYEFGWIDFFKESEKLLFPDVYALIKHDSLENNAGWPNRFGDYLACGKPILANLYGELNEFYSKYPNSILIVENNENSISKKIYEILDGKFKLTEIGNYNINIAKNDYSWEQKASELADIYEKLMKKKVNPELKE